MLVDERLVDRAEPEGGPSAPRRFTDFSVRELMRLLWRQRAEIALAALIFASAAVAIGKSLTPTYTASAQLYVDPRELQLAGREPKPPAQDSSKLAMVFESQLRLITSNSVLLQVIQDNHLDEDPEFSGASAREAAPMAALETLNRHISVTNPDHSFIINVEVWSKDPAKAALLANAICNAYLDEMKKSQALAVRRAATYLSDRLKELQERIRNAENALAAYQAQQKAADEPERLAHEQKLSANNQQLAAARAATLEAQARFDQIEASRRDAIDIDALPEALQSPAIAGLRAQYARSRRRYAELASEFGPLYPSLRQIESHMDDLRRGIRDEVDRLAQTAQDDLARARDYEAALNKEIKSQKQQVAQPSQPSPRLRELQGNVAASRDVYQSFLDRWRETGEQKGPSSLSARVVGEATTTGRRTFPPAMSLFASSGLLLGALFGSVWFAAASRRPPKASEAEPAEPETAVPTPSIQSPSIQSPDIEPPDIEPPDSEPPDSEPAQEATVASMASIEKPLIARLQESDVVRAQSSVLITGALPDLTRIGWPTLRTALPQKTFLKFVADMRAAVMRRPSAGAIPVIAVIGAGASEDRSVAALNIALAAARGGARVFLIDADHATRALSNQLNGPGKSKAGRFGWLGFGAKASVAVETTNGISVLPVNKASDAKASEAICKAITEVRSFGGYDLVILDGPATPSSVADRRLLDVADGLVVDLPMSLDINDCVRDIIAALGDLEPKLIGFVLNELQPTAAADRQDRQPA